MAEMAEMAGMAMAVQEKNVIVRIELPECPTCRPTEAKEGATSKERRDPKLSKLDIT